MQVHHLKAIVGATVIDGTGRPPLRDSVVLIEGRRIKSLTPAPAAVLPEQAEVISAHDAFIIPGLMDANVHLASPIPEVVLRHEGRYEALIEEAAQVTLRSGVTTVFDTWGPLAALVSTRDRINRGAAAGSRMFVAGNIIGFDGPFSPDFFPPAGLLGADTVARINSHWEQEVGSGLLWLTPDGVRHRVREYIERSNIDLVKYAASGHGGSFSAFIAFSELAQRAIAEEARRAGLTVQTHSTTVESLRIAVSAEVDILQHGEQTGPEPMPQATLQTIVERKLPVSAILSTERHLAWVHKHGSERMRKHVYSAARDENSRRLIAAGARLLLATDGLVAGPGLAKHPLVAPLVVGDDSPNVLGESHFRWLEAAIERGMAAMEALLSATRYIAEAYGVAADLGTLEPGKQADLVILDADPLADVRNYRRIAKVMKGGVLVDRGALPGNRILTV